MKQGDNIPIFEDPNSKRDIEFFPDVVGSYAIRNSAIEHHSDAEGDPWSIFSPAGGHMATFCPRKSKINLWPFPLNPDHDGTPRNIESIDNCTKLVRVTDIKIALKNAARFAWLKWPYAKKSANTNTVLKLGKNGLFSVPYNIDREIYGSTGAYLIFDSNGAVVGRVARDRHLETNTKIYKGYYKYDGSWYEETLEDGMTSKEILSELFYIISEESSKYERVKIHN